jgi:hypothetical protein
MSRSLSLPDARDGRNPSSRLCKDPLAERLGVDEPGEGALAVDLDDRQVLAVPRLELRIAADVDHLELERHLAPDGVDGLERRVAEVAAGSGVDADAGYG